MSSASRRLTGRLLFTSGALACAGVTMVGWAGSARQLARTSARPELRVCADPNNLPFSNRAEEGFENRIASLIAADLHMPLAYTWFPQRRGFVRNTLRAKLCDVIIGVPAGYDPVARTAPYYRSTYVFVSRADRHLDIRSFDDATLPALRIGVHMMGDDYTNSPAAVALQQRGLGHRIVPYMIYGDYDKPDPPADLIAAVERGDIDVAVAWGPLAGYMATRSRTPLRVEPVVSSASSPLLRFTFSIAMGVRHGDATRHDALDSVIARRATEIRRILTSYGVPLVSVAPRGEAVP